MKVDAQSLQEKAKIQYFLSMIEDKDTDVQQKIAFYDSTIVYYHNIKKTEKEREMALKKMKLAYDNGIYLEAYRTGMELINRTDKNTILSADDSTQINSIRLLMGRTCRNLGMYDESISHFFSVIQQPHSRQTIDAYSYLGLVFMQMRQMEKSKTYNDLAIKSLAEADSITKQKSSCNIYNTFAGYHYTNNQLDSALFYLNLSVDYFDYADNMYSKSYIYHNMAVIYQEMGEYSMAKDYFFKAIDISHNEPYNYARFLQNLAYLFYENDELAEAEKYYYEALDISEKAGIFQVKSSVLTELAQLFYKKQQYRQAYDYLNQGVQLRDSIFSNESIEKISLLSQQFENYKINSEKEYLQKELQVTKLSSQRKSIILTILISLLVILSIIAYILIRRIHIKSLATIKKETEAEQEAIHKGYEMSLEEKNRKLASNALFLMKTNEMLTSIEKSIKQLSATHDLDKQKKIADEITSVINLYNSGQGWEEFKYYFEQVHNSFYVNLNKINPTLSQMEQRLCALLLLNMNTKEIAQITNRSVRTIETLIYRLRKNLNIPQEEKTVHFLRKLSDYEEGEYNAEKN